MRLADRREHATIERLAALTEQAAPADTYLVAEVDGRLWAALPLSGGEPFADPFLPALEVKALLSLRAAQLTDAAEESHDERPNLTPALSLEGGAR